MIRPWRAGSARALPAGSVEGHFWCRRQSRSRGPWLPAHVAASRAVAGTAGVIVDESRGRRSFEKACMCPTPLALLGARLLQVRLTWLAWLALLSADVYSSEIQARLRCIRAAKNLQPLVSVDARQKAQELTLSRWVLRHWQCWCQEFMRIGACGEEPHGVQVTWAKEAGSGQWHASAVLAPA